MLQTYCLSATDRWEGNVKLRIQRATREIERREAEGDRHGGHVGTGPEYIVYLVVCMCILV